ncbi:unnamed protein product [Hermetia illucens]|uniref:Uncharacterized protein n=1 Tax=Hermetia illucens TaxID=343691 RepID=A0A7R8YUM6_HERIL|nr:unnamed protein product [Hermetia illucens]
MNYLQQSEETTEPLNTAEKTEISITPESPEVFRIILPPGRCTKRLLNISDVFLSLFVITPLVVAHWKGTWAFIERHPEQFPPWMSFLFGCTLHTSFVLIKELLHMEFTAPNDGYKSVKKIISQNIIVKIYTYLFSLGCNLNWQGGWAALQVVFGTELKGAVIPSAICLVLLLALKGIRNLAAPPVFVALDNKDIAFSFPTRFRVQVSQILN